MTQQVTSLLLCLALLVTVAFVNASGGRNKNKKGGGYGYQPPQKVIILPAGPSVTYPWVGHCPPKGKCKHIPYVKRPPFPSLLPPAPPLPYYAPVQYVPSYSAPVPQQAYVPAPPAYPQPAPQPYAPEPQPYAPEPQPYAPAPEPQSYAPAPDYSQSAASGFVASQPIYSAPAPEAGYNSVAPAANPTPYNAAPQDFSAPAQLEYAAVAPAEVIQEIAAPDVQEYSAPAPQEVSVAPAQQEYSAPVEQEYAPQAQQEYSAPAAVQEYSAAPVDQEYSSAPVVQGYAGPDTQEFVVQAVQQYAPESADVETSQVDYQPTGDVSVVPAFASYEEPPSANSASYPELTVEQQTAPSWGPVAGPYGETVAPSNSGEVQSYSAAEINEPVIAAEPQGNEQAYSPVEAQPEQPVQTYEQPAFEQPSWEPAQQIDNILPEATLAPEIFDIQGEYAPQEPVQQQEGVAPYESEAYELDNQQAEEIGEYSENNYGTRIKPRGAQQRRQN